MDPVVATVPWSEPVVVKLGGSLFETHGSDDRPAIPGLLDILARASRPLVIVPGGGLYADVVRSEQQRLGLSDRAAHRMALWSMHQTACAIVDLQPVPPRMQLTSSLDDIALYLRQQMIPVWQPLPMLDAAPELPQDWTITSDGIAAWLGGKLQAARVVLVKSAMVDAELSAEQLARDGVIDPLFAPLIQSAGLAWSVIGAGEGARLAVLVGADMQLDRSR